MKKFIVLAVFFSKIMFAQEAPELITDRPDVTESAVTVPLNFWQIETGMGYHGQKYFDSSSAVENKELHLGSTLFRYGITGALELRFGGEYFSGRTIVNSINHDEQGISGLFVGAKYMFVKNSGAIDKLACLLEVSLPFGNQNLHPPGYEPTIIVAAQKNILTFLDLSVNIGLEYKSDIEKYNSFYSGSFGFDLGNRWGMFIEYFGNAMKEALPRNNIDFGFTYSMRENIQLDTYAGSIIFNDDTDWFSGLGVSVRLPR